MLTLPIQIGKRYVRRDGRIITALKHHPDIDDCTAYVGDKDEAEDRGDLHVYLSSGKINRYGLASPLDLMEDAVEARPKRDAVEDKPRHPYAEALEAIIEGKQMEVMRGGEWMKCDHNWLLREIASASTLPGSIRVKPETRTVTMELPVPITVKPEGGQRYYRCVGQHGAAEVYTWCDDLYDNRWFDSFSMYATAADAEAARAAIQKARKEAAE